MPEAFISYSRVDAATVRQLQRELAARGRDIWVDWEDIRPTEAFMDAIKRAIEAANIFVFIISPDSVKSTICLRELEHAVAHRKKLVPVVCRDVRAESTPAALAPLNWIFGREADDTSQAVDGLIQAMDTDLDWLRTHTRLVVRATEWDRSARNKSFLMHGVDLDQAERALAQAALELEPQPTVLQREYVLASRRAASKRQRSLFVGVAVALIVSLGLAWFAEARRRDAEEARLRGLARQLAAQSELVRRPLGEPLTLSLLLAAESLRHYWSLEGDLALRRALAFLPKPPVRTDAHGEASGFKLSADGHFLAMWRNDGKVQVVDTWTGASVAEWAQPATLSMMWSSDARYLVTDDESSHTVRVWSMAQRDVIASFQSGGRLNRVAFRHDDERIAVVESDAKDLRSVRVWDLKANRQVALFSPSFAVQNLAFDATGHRVITLGSKFLSTAIEVWEAPFKQPVAQHKMDGHVASSVFDATGSLLAFVNPVAYFGGGTSGMREVKLYRIEFEDSGGNVRFNSTILTHPCDVSEIALSPEGNHVLTSCRDNVVRQWSTADASPGARVSVAGPVLGIVAGPEAELIAIRGKDEFIGLFSLPTGRHVASLHHPRATAMAFSQDKHYVTIVDIEGHTQVRGVDVGSAAYHATVSTETRDLHFRPDGAMLATCTGDGAYLLRLGPKAEMVSLPKSGNALGCAFSSDGSRFFTVSASGSQGGLGGIKVIGDNNIRTWDTSTGRELAWRARGDLTDFAVSSNGRYIALSDRSPVIMIAELDSGKVVRRLTLPENAISKAPSKDMESVPPRIVTDLEFSLTGEHLAMVYQGRRAQVWDVASRTPGAVIELPIDSHIASLTPDGQHVATANRPINDSHTRLWESRTGREILFGAPARYFQTIAFGMDSRLVATVAGDRQVETWDLANNHKLATFLHPALVYSLAFSPDGKYIATGSADGTARIWDRVTSREMARMSYEKRVFGLAFSPNGRHLAVRGWFPDVWIEIWRREDLLEDAGERASRNLTSEEWDRYLPDEPYRPTFPKLPGPPTSER